MILSTKTRYGTRLILELALNFNKGPIHLKSIAASEQISVKYLEQIANHLKTAKIIESKRGAGGGYYIEKPLTDITLLDVVESLEGSLSLVECVETGICKRKDHCVTNKIWADLSAVLKNKLKSITLNELVEKYKEKVLNHKMEYCI